METTEETPGTHGGTDDQIIKIGGILQKIDPFWKALYATLKKIVAAEWLLKVKIPSGHNSLCCVCGRQQKPILLVQIRNTLGKEKPSKLSIALSRLLIAFRDGFGHDVDLYICKPCLHTIKDTIFTF